MSLAHAAEHLKRHGRGPDTELIHMSKKEIKGLQELALAHGGSLTINPHTGLPEAGFLENLLPTIIGVGLSVASGGALTPLMAAGITGAGYGIATGDLNKGLMAGLGAYGGAGLGAGLSSAGAAVADTAATTATNQAAATIGQESANLGLQTAQTAGLDTAGQKAAEEAFRRQAIDQGGNAISRAAAPSTIGGNLTQAGEGFKSLSGSAGRNAFMAGTPTGTLPALGFSAVNAAAPEQKMPGSPEPDQYDRRLAGYKLAPDYKAYEAPRPNPYYSAQYQNYAEGGITGMPPQTNFADPSQSMMGTSQYDMPTDPMSGNIAQRMAEGGVTGSGQMQLNVPLSVGGAEGGGGGGLGGGGGYGGYDGPEDSVSHFGFDGTGGPGASFGGGGGYAPPGGPKAGVTYGMPPMGMSGMSDMLRGALISPPYQGPMYDSTNSTTSADMGYPMQQQPMQRGIGGKGGMGPQLSDVIGPSYRPEIENQRMQRGIGFAQGGIASYRKGGHLSASAGIPDTGIYYDSDLTTRGEQALGASQAKNKQLYKRAGLKYVEGPKSGIEKLGGGFSEAAAGGGLSHLGGYSDGGRMLKGPGDGMSDDIPAMIGKKQPARLADGEFVVPADVVSHLGNGSTDAGAKKLYSMMNKIRKARTGRKAQGKQINPNKFLPS